MKVLVAGDKSPITHRAVSCFGLLPRHEPDCSNIEFSTGSIRTLYRISQSQHPPCDWRTLKMSSKSVESKLVSSNTIFASL